MDYRVADAEISGCGRFRYWLRREWDGARPTLPVCMLNPSTADGDTDDGTVRALVGHADRWGYGGLAIVNLYARRASKPEVMFAETDRLGPENAARLDAVLLLAESNGGRLLVAWGNDGDHEGQASRFVARASAARVELVCLGTTLGGAPLHPAARGRHRPDADARPLPWPPVERRFTCSGAERDLLNTIQVWPDRPAVVTWRANGTWALYELEPLPDMTPDPSKDNA